jgi:hypothetical protein
MIVETGRRNTADRECDRYHTQTDDSGTRFVLAPLNSRTQREYDATNLRLLPHPNEIGPALCRLGARGRRPSPS